MYYYLARKLVDKTQLNLDFMRVYEILGKTKQELRELDDWYNHNCLGSWQYGSSGYAFYGYDSSSPREYEYDYRTTKLFEKTLSDLKGLVKKKKAMKILNAQSFN